MGEEAASIAAPHKKRTSGGLRWQQRHPRVRRARRAGGGEAVSCPSKAKAESLPSLCVHGDCRAESCKQKSLKCTLAHDRVETGSVATAIARGS
eukprot:410239-Amphidinium_carterae.1